MKKFAAELRARAKCEMSMKYYTVIQTEKSCSRNVEIMFNHSRVKHFARAHLCHACGTSPANLDCRVARAGASVLAEPPQGAREHLVKVGDELHALEEEAILSNYGSKYRVPSNCQD